MRRIPAFLLAILIGLPAISPLFALSSAGDLNRPACCRRDGKHHCMLVDMDSAATSSAVQRGNRATAVTVSGQCPYGSSSLPGSTQLEWKLQDSAAVFAGIVAQPAMVPQTESKRRISADRSRQKRGPPVVASMIASSIVATA